MGEPDAELGKALPQVTLLGRPSLPPGLQDLVSRERAAVADQLVSQYQGLVGWQRLLGYRLDAGGAVRQGSAEGIAGPLLAWATSPIAISCVGQDRLPSLCSPSV